MSEHQFVYDDFAWKLAGRLLEDFEPLLPPSILNAAKSAQADRNVGAWRSLTLLADRENLNPYQFKLLYQIQDLFKKFKFQNDLHTPDQLIETSVKKFMDNQERLTTFSLDKSPLVREVLFRTRGYVDQILGYFDPLEIMSEATFGKKSSVGIPLSKACEGARYESPITGSRDHITWFDKIYGSYNRPAYNYAVSRAETLSGPLYRDVDTVEAVLVDKTWKSLRMICPNTTIGTLYSGGLGRVLEGRLRTYGYDIKHLQQVHGELARFGSITGSLVTADQSMASDNITVKLIDEIFPRPWASALKLGRISGMMLYGQRLETPTFSTMGIGFTFPLQTLVFLSLLLAIRDHKGLDDSSVVSVFGDDLIYDVEMHDLVVNVFPALGLVINEDKTFAEGFFRESCGYDYYHGVNVRPFHLGKAEGITAGKRRSESYLYKTLNSLMRRWEPLEVPSAAELIISLLREVRKNEPLTVPTDYPDESGCKLTQDNADLLGLKLGRKRDIHGTYRFRYLAFQPDLMRESRESPYYFLALRNGGQVESIKSPLIRGAVGEVIRDSPPLLKVEDDPDGRSYRCKHTGRRKRPQITSVTKHGRGRYRERSGVTSNWTPEAQG